MSGPKQLAGGKSNYDDRDGRWHHTFRQSTLGDADECAERGRLTLTDEMPRIETDAAAVGTACHAAFEWMIEQGIPDAAAAIAIAQAEFDVVAAMDNFEWKKYSPKVVPQIIEHVVNQFIMHVWDRLDPIDTEIGFEGIVIHEDDKRVIYVNGTIDYFDRVLGGGDWKTSGDNRKYQGGFGGDGWKLDRWNIQATVYSKALVEMGFIDPVGPWPFTFYGFTVPYGGVEEYTVLRSPADHLWLAEKCEAWAVLIEADLDVWPKQDNHALCSPAWCSAWSSCKGKHYADGPWPRKMPKL